jgi:dTMP kinase
MLRQFLDGWKYIGGSPLVRGLVLGIFGAFGCGGIVVGTAKFFATSLGAGEAAFSLLFGTLFIGLAVGIGLGPMVVRELSRRRWFGMSIVLASGSVIFLAFSIHLSMALLGALLVGAGAGMAFLAGTTLLGGEVGDDVRGRVFAVVQIGTRVVLMLAIALSGVLVGFGGSRRVELGDAAVDISSTRVLLLVAGAAGVLTGISAFRQMDDKRGVPVLADLWGSVRGRPLSPAEPFSKHGIFVVFEGGEGAGKSTQVDRLAATLQAEGRDVAVTREPGATDVGSRIRSLVLDPDGSPSPRAEALLYAADRAHHVATVVRPAMARGAVVISDRYVDSSLAYQGAGRTLPVNEISWLSSWATGGLKPDLVVLLDVEPSVGLSRAAARGEGADRLEAESQTFHERVRYAFLDLAAADPKRYLVLDAARSPDEIAALVAARVRGILAADDAHLAPLSTAVPSPSAASSPPADETQVIHPGAPDPAPVFRVGRSSGAPPATPADTLVVPTAERPGPVAGSDATQVVPPAAAPDATQVVRPASAHRGGSADETTQEVPAAVIADAAAPAPGSVDATQVIRPPAADGPDATQIVPSSDPTQVVASPPPIEDPDGSDSPPDESPTDVAAELTGRGTPVRPASDDAGEPARPAGTDDTARARRR